MSNMEFVPRFTLSHPGTSNPVRLASNIAVAERGRFLPTSMKRPRSVSRSRTPANQKPAASALRDYCGKARKGVTGPADRQLLARLSRRFNEPLPYQL